MKSDTTREGRARRLREAGLKATATRLAILAELEEDLDHPSAEALFERLRTRYPSLSLSTVYQSLEAFLRAGLCRRAPNFGGRMRVDGTLDDHDHATCIGCGRIFDIPTGSRQRLKPPSSLPGGLRVERVRVEFDVLCSSCHSADSRTKPSP